MKILLTTLNSKYIHSSLALRYIEKFLNKYKDKNEYKIIVKEFSINEVLDRIMAEIYTVKADLIAFSCYIWNKELTFELIDRLKKVAPNLIIVVGGPEVSYDTVNLLEENPYLDIIIKGEGELSFKELLDEFLGFYNKAYFNSPNLFNYNKVIENIDICNIDGIVFRNGHGEIIENQDRELIAELDIIPRPYTGEELNKLKNKIIYYEASRGCPYNCSYCLSSTIKGVRGFSLERVKKDLLFFIDNDVQQVKFVDRTFNYDKKRTLEIFRFLLKYKKNTSFHFEITADLLDKEVLDFLIDIPDGLFQFEIGVQSTNERTLELICRKTNFKFLAEKVRFLRERDNINLHLDLIAGLPEEDYKSFKRSFNMVYDLNPQVLQLGFLKLLKGSRIRNMAEKYRYKYTESAPYEVLQNKNISYQDLLKLKDIEYLLDKYHNSGVFRNSLKFIFRQHYQSYFSFYEDFADFFISNNLQRQAHSRKSLYTILYSFYNQYFKYKEIDLDKFREILKYDLILNNSGTKIPDWASKFTIEGFNNQRYQFLDNEKNIKRILPHLSGKSVRDILKLVRFEFFSCNVVDEFSWNLNKYNFLQLEEANYRVIEEKNKEFYCEKIYVILFDYSKKQKPTAYNVTSDFDLNKKNSRC